jgi:hypothetical protein
MGNLWDWFSMSVNAILPDLRNPWFFVGAGAVGTGNGTNVTAAVPAGYHQGDLLVLMCNTTGSISTPSGWTAQLLNQTLHLINMSVFTKIAGASESSVVITTALGAADAVMLCYRNIAATPLDVAGTVATVVNNVNVPTNSIASTFDSDLIISFYAYDAVSETWTAPANTNTRVQQNSGGTLVPFLIVDENMPVSGNTTVRTAVVSATSAGTGGGSFALSIKQI